MKKAALTLLMLATFSYLSCANIKDMANLKNLTGNTYGRLTVLKFIKTIKSHSFWECSCVCGKIITTTSNQLKRGTRKSCGCLMIDVNRDMHLRHGESSNITKEYRTWSRMRSRCLNKKVPDFNNYGGRGIKVCDRWMNSYESFLEDMGRAPSKDHSIDRIDVNGNYEPNNCRWATINEQARNKRRNIYINHQGSVVTLTEYCKLNNLAYATISYRIRAGWPVELALTQPIKHPIEVKTETKSE